METYTIYQRGSRYATFGADGRIQRVDGMNTASDSWRIVGAVRLNNFGYEVEYFTLDEVLAGGIQWSHRNGKQRVHLLDIDHGTRRMWGSPSHFVE